MHACPPGSIPQGQLGTDLQVDLQRAMPKGRFPSYPGTVRAVLSPEERGQARGAARDLAGRPWSPFPAAVRMHVVQSPLVTDCIAACARIQLDSSPRGDVPHAWWQAEGEGWLPQCRGWPSGGDYCCLGPWTAMAQFEACPSVFAGSQDSTQHRSCREQLREAGAAGIQGKACGHLFAKPGCTQSPKGRREQQGALAPASGDPAALCQPLFSKQ